MKKIAAIVLAAGKGTRMKSRLPKVLHRVAGRPMLHYPLAALKKADVTPVVCMIGHNAELVREAFIASGYKGLEFAVQAPQLGTGHAVMCAGRARGLKRFKGDVLILSGDAPLIRPETIKGLVKFHRAKAGKKVALTILTAIVSDPTGYGRIIRDESGEVLAIVEETDATAPEKRICEINSGIYVVDSDFLFKNIKKLGTANKQGEYYLPDLVPMAREYGFEAKALTHLDPSEVMGVNNRVELATACKVMRGRILHELMLSGVTIVDPATTYIADSVTIGQDAVIEPGAHISGDTVIGEGVMIEDNVAISDSKIGANTRIRRHSTIESSVIGKDAIVGPYARLRPGTVLQDDAHVGNFVEIKNSNIGKGSKANHLTYIGDSDVGAGVNIGAGTITCNYDGVKKYRTIIKDNVFIGSDSQLIAPVTIGRGAYVGSGSTVTEDVPPGALALSRVEQKNIPGWVKKRFGKGKK